MISAIGNQIKHLLELSGRKGWRELPAHWLPPLWLQKYEMLRQRVNILMYANSSVGEGRKTFDEYVLDHLGIADDHHRRSTEEETDRRFLRILIVELLCEIRRVNAVE